MTDSRPLPEYGEYATPEEQARAMGREYPEPVPVAAPPQDAVPASAVPLTGAGFANRFFTVFLLGVGGLFLLGSLPGYFQFRTAMKLGEAQLGVDVPVPASLDRVGIWMLVVNVVLYLGTLVWSVSAVRRGRASAYIPVVGCILFLLSTGIVFNVIAPGFAAQLSS